MAKDISLEIEATNLGPHHSLKAKDQISSLELGIFANNGAGKTFISRAFRLIENDDIKVGDTNKLLTLGQSTAHFRVEIGNSKEPGVRREVDIQIKKNSPTVIRNTTGYKFHVFNRDYVKENLEELKYRPSGKIEGYILGKDKIDLTKERDTLSMLKRERAKRIERLETSIRNARKELEDYGVRRNTIEYVALNLENIVSSPKKYQEPETFENLKVKQAKLKAIPDSLQDVTNIDSVSVPSFLTDMTQFLTTSFNRSMIADEFKQKIKGKQSFIEFGIGFMGDNRSECPFCEQELEKNALQLIDRYLEYLNDTEAQQIRRVNGFISSLEHALDRIRGVYYGFLEMKEKYNDMKSFLPSIEGKELNSLDDPRGLEVFFAALLDILSRKKANVSLATPREEIETNLNVIVDWIMKSNERIRMNSELIEAVNTRKQNLQTERLDLNKRLCKSRYTALAALNEHIITEITDLNHKISAQEDDIVHKEQTEKVSKKEKVVETFKTFLTQFFGEKYAFDEAEFCLRFLDHSLTENAQDVLSDGEKSIVAFCYFLAETHRMIEKEDDYKNLFFVIDDPISSLDFHYVYALAHAIRSLNMFFPMVRIRYLILTHNLEFMSILIRNNIVSHRYFMSAGKLKELRRDLIMPYEEHLRDIYDISISNSEPSHTTPNSIRHVLETLNRFVAPNTEFSRFCDGVEGFQANAFLYSLIQDSSHGGIRSQRAYTDEMIKSGCGIIIKYLENNYAGQIALLKV